MYMEWQAIATIASKQALIGGLNSTQVQRETDAF